MDEDDKPLVWLQGEIKTPPLSQVARLEAGFLLRQLQQGESLGMPQSRPMPAIGVNCHELRIRGAEQNWRIVYCIDDDAILTWQFLAKRLRQLPKTSLMFARSD